MSLRPLGAFLFGISLLLPAAAVQSQSFSVSPCADSDTGEGWFSHRQACELRRATISLPNARLAVAGNNGNIEVVGEDRRDVALEARVVASAPSKDEAQTLLHQVKVVTDGTIHAEGPNNKGFFSSGSRNWSVSYKLRVPRHVLNTELTTSNGNISASELEGRLSAESSNGGIVVRHVDGDVRASTTNGELNLENLAGTVHAETTNGGVRISLAGDRWRGSGLYAKSTNGGVTIKAPDRFAAHLVAETTNGGISVDFPIQVQGRVGHSINTDLNGGGPLVQLETTNGGISINHL